MEEQKQIDEFMKLESFMLPPQFRRRSAWRQRLTLIVIMMVYAVSMGLFAYTIIGGLKENFVVYTDEETTYFLIGIIMPAMLMFVFGSFIAWSRARTYITSITGLIGYLIPPIILAAGIIYMSLLDNEDIFKFLELNGLMTMAAGSISVIYVIIRNSLKAKTYREAKYRTLYTTPGILVAAASPYLLKVLTNGKTLVEAGNNPVYMALGAFGIGVLLFAVGIALSTKYMLSPEKNIWNAIRFTSGLPALVIYTMLIATSFSKAITASIILPTIFQTVLQLLVLGGFISYLFMKARIKNMNQTNPLYNEVALKLFIVTILIITLIMIYILPMMSPQKGYGEYSFAMLAMGGFIIVIGIVAAHFMNLITYNKYSKSTIGGIAFATILIYAIALVIASLQHASIIADIMGRSLAITFGIIALIFQLVTLAVNLSYVLASTVQKPRGLKDKKKEDKKKGDK